MTKQFDVVVVTGACGTMGLEICKRLLEEFYYVIGIDYNIQRAAMPIQHLLEKFPDQLSVIRQDLCNGNIESTLPTVVELDKNRINNEFKPLGKVVGLVNAAGVSIGDDIENMSHVDWDDSFKVNVTAPMKLIKWLTPYMIQSDMDCSIVNVGSPAGVAGARKPSYAASKAALHGLTMSCARNLGKYGIRVNTLLPGPVISNMTGDWPEEKRNKIAEESYLGRLCTAKEVANVVHFLISDQSSYITGSQIDISAGGLHGHK